MQAFMGCVSTGSEHSFPIMGRSDDMRNNAPSGGLKEGFNRNGELAVNHQTLNNVERQPLYVEKHVDSQQNCSNVDEPGNCHSSTLAPTEQKQTQNNHPDSLCEKETIDSFEAFVDNSSGSADDLTAEFESSSLLAEGGLQLAHHNSACAGKKSHSDKVRYSRTLSKQCTLADAIVDKVAQRLKCVLDNVSAKSHSVYGRYFPEDWALLHSAHSLKNVLVLPSTFFCDPGHLLTASIREKARFEFFRLSTFAQLEDLVVSPIRLAENGFYYDEELDDIICFSCGFRKREWSEAERTIALVHLEQSEEYCLQANIRDARNVPVRADFPDESSQSTSEAREGEPSNSEEITDTDGETADAQGLGDSNFPRDYSDTVSEPRERETNRNVQANEIYTTDEETTDAQGTFQASASQSMSYTPTSITHETQGPVSLQETTLTLITANQTKQGLDGETSQSNGIVEISATASSRHPESSWGPSSEPYDSRSPAQPEQAPAATPNNVGLDGSASAGNTEGSDQHEIGLLDMRHAASAVNAAVTVRLATFVDWPTRGLPRPRSLVIAGFYYMGTGDSVRCFYCGVTLRNWRENDDPWETHVRFRFSCDYVMAVRGENFIIETQVKLSTSHCISTLLRETETSISSGTGEFTSGHVSAIDFTSRESPPITAATGNFSSRNIETGSNIAHITTITGSACAGSSSSHNVETSSLPRSQELQTDSEHIATTSTAAPNGPASRLLSGRQAATTTPQTPYPSHTTVSREHPSSSNTPRTITDQDGVTLQNLQDTNRRLRQRVTCRVCRSRSVDTIFLPCGHLCTCEVCAATITECCLCGDRIRGTAHVYME